MSSPARAVPFTRLSDLLASLDQPSPVVVCDAAADGAPPFALPSRTDKYRQLQVTLLGRVCAITSLTRRLTFISLKEATTTSLPEADDSASSVSSHGSSRHLHLVLKKNDGTGWDETQQAALQERLKVGDELLVHAFIEINAAAGAPAAGAAPTVAATAGGGWHQSHPESASPDAPGPAASSSSSSSSSVAASLLDTRIYLHAISVCRLVDAAAAGAVDSHSQQAGIARLAEQLVRHSRRFEEAVREAAAATTTESAEAAANSSSSSSSSSSSIHLDSSASVPSSSSPASSPFLPSISGGVAAELARLSALAQIAENVRRKHAPTAADADAADGQADAATSSSSAASALPVAPLSRKAQHKKEQAERESQGLALKKRTPKCNVNRGSAFYDFLHATFGADLLATDGGVLDIAGGQGQLAFQLSKRDLPCTIVDPRAVEGGAWAQKRQAYLAIRTKLAAEGARPMPIFNHAQTYFNRAFVTNEATRDLWTHASLIVGMHPDQPSQDLVVLALEHDKPFAIVPCCVFPHALHPNRRNRAGEHVRTHEQLCQYFMELDPSIRRAELPFEGRNTVIYRLPTNKG